nr:polyadenylate-binding protein 8-like [Ipomoea batatas]
MNQMLSTVGAMAAVAKVASTAYYYAEHFGVFNREAKGEAETRSVEVAENQSANELNRQNSVDESVLSRPADAIECREAWNVEMESRGYTDEPNQKKAVDELVLSYAAEANDPKDAASSEDGIGKESGDIENNNYGSKKGSRGISNRGGRGGKNCGHFNNNQGGHGGQDGECSNNSRGGRGGQGRGHINNNWGGRGGKGRGHIDNKRGGHRGHSNNNQGDCRGTGSGCSKNQGGRGRGGLDDGCFNSNKGHSGGIDNGYFNNGSEAADYNSKNAKSESASSCTTNATETKEALDAHAIQQGRQANTEVHAQPQAGNPNGGEGQSLTTLLVSGLDVSVTDLQLLGIFIRYGQVVSSGVFRDIATHCSLGYGYVTYGNPQDADRALKELNFTPLNGKPIQIMYFQQDSTKHKSGGFNSKKSDYGGIDGAHFKNQGGRVGTDGGCFNNKDSKLSGYNSKNPNFESVSSCSTNATESRDASDAPQQGHQANTEVKAQPQVGNPSGGSILIKNLDKAIDDRALHAIFSAFGNILSCKVETDASGQSKGYGRIEYDSEEAAQEAIEKVNGTEQAVHEAIEKVNGTLLNHKKVYVRPFVSKQEKDIAKSTKVYVANLSESTTKEDLREVFCYFGKIASTVVVRDEDGKSKCFGFVNFKDADDASWSIEVLNGHKFDNKEWCVRRAQKKSVKKS